jgi:hypothetical protein
MADQWNNIPTVIYDMITSYMKTRERLIIIERICSSFHKHSINGFGWQHNIDLLLLSSLPSLSMTDTERLDKIIISLGLTTRLRYHNHIQYLRASPLTSKLALSMGSWTNLRSFELFTDQNDNGDGSTKSLSASLFGLMILE